MKIAILGYGKMGRKIGELATKLGHVIICTSNSNSPARLLDLSTSDVAIDFSTPRTAFENISHAIQSGIPVVSGTTNWLDRLDEITELCNKKNGAFLYSPNFSLGVNILFKLNEELAKLMKNQNYTRRIHEIHHTQKLDAPSGTAIALRKEIDRVLKNKTKITTDRIDDIPGTHQIIYSSKVDAIEIKHTANNRNGFAKGAIIAAEWIIGKKGIYSMQDVLE